MGAGVCRCRYVGVVVGVRRNVGDGVWVWMCVDVW